MLQEILFPSLGENGKRNLAEKKIEVHIAKTGKAQMETTLKKRGYRSPFTWQLWGQERAHTETGSSAAERSCRSPPSSRVPSGSGWRVPGDHPRARRPASRPPLCAWKGAPVYGERPPLSLQETPRQRGCGRAWRAGPRLPGLGGCLPQGGHTQVGGASLGFPTILNPW